MRFLTELMEKIIPKHQKPKLIHAIQDAYSLNILDVPIMETNARCPLCGGSEGYAVFINPIISDKRMWFCKEPICLASMTITRDEATQTISKASRSLEWPLFCEINGIGDLHHNVKFENIEQSSGKIEYLLKFATKPCGIIFMQGNPGTGKTYASMAVCELFTRNNVSAKFCTQSKMQSMWLEEDGNFTHQLEICNLLVIDDFGTGQVTTGFMKFLLDLINTRMQWSDRGTIISTNLNDKDFSNYCGSALNDRIKTGQKFEFKDKSRRKPIVL